MFQGSDEVQKTLLHDSCRAIRFALTCLSSTTSKVYSTTMESLPLKVLDFGLQRPTGPSSGLVASGLSRIGLPRSEFG